MHARAGDWPVPDPRDSPRRPIAHPLRLNRAAKGEEEAVSGGSGRIAGRSCAAPPSLASPPCRGLHPAFTTFHVH